MSTNPDAIPQADANREAMMRNASFNLLKAIYATHPRIMDVARQSGRLVVNPFEQPGSQVEFLL